MRLLHTMLRVGDLKASIQFYCDVLGCGVWGEAIRFLLRINWRLKPLLYNQSPPTRTAISA
jgi:catechol 2,3-dioxygenase-like lactoylglutathione lyase family enzyme